MTAFGRLLLLILLIASLALPAVADDDDPPVDDAPQAGARQADPPSSEAAPRRMPPRPQRGSNRSFVRPAQYSDQRQVYFDEPQSTHDGGNAPAQESAPEEVFGEPADDSFQDAWEAPAPAVSSAEWLRNCCWYTQQSAVFMSREASVKNTWTLSHDFSSSILPHYITFLEIPVNYGFKPGIRSVIGHSLGRDDRNRDHAVEFTYLGLTTWKAAGSLTAVSSGGIFTDISVDPTLSTPVFNQADAQSFAATSNLHSYELNYRVDRRLARDQVVYTRDSSWVRRDAPSPLPSILLGARIVTINETLNWASSSSLGNGTYNVQTQNLLAGLQGGFEYFFEGSTFRAGVRTKAGGFVNWVNADSQVQILDLSGNPLRPNRNTNISSSVLAAVAELGFAGSYRIRPNFSLRASYDLLWVTSLGLAQNQLTFSPSNPPMISDHHFLLYQGASFGFEFCR